MNSETFTPPQPQETNVPQNEDPFAVIQGMQNQQGAEQAFEQREAVRRAQRLLEDNPQPVDTSATAAPRTPSHWGTKAKVTTGIVIGAAIGSGATAVAVDHILPGQEIASSSTTVQTGEGIEPSINRDIAQIESQKIDPADATERQDVISQAVDIHYNQGVVPAGEQVTVIAEKSPIFGNVTYKAVPNDNGDIAAVDPTSK